MLCNTLSMPHSAHWGRPHQKPYFTDEEIEAHLGKVTGYCSPPPKMLPETELPAIMGATHQQTAGQSNA